MRKAFLVLLILTVALVPMIAQTKAIVKEVKGKVEIKLPGRGWQRARGGMIIPKGATISTGFKSSAVLQLGKSMLQVKPLTRMTLEELIQKNGVVSTKLFLRVGKIKAKVRSAKGLRQNFKLKSPVSTAAVRGTDFEYDGIHLKVEEGVVRFFNLLAQRRDIIAGEESETDGFDLPLSGELGRLAGSDVSSDTSGGEGGTSGGFEAGASTGSIIVQIPLN